MASMDLLALARTFHPRRHRSASGPSPAPGAFRGGARTSGIVSDTLARLGIPHQTGVGGMKGVVATIEGTGTVGNGKCFALRADMDACRF